MSGRPEKELESEEGEKKVISQWGEWERDTKRDTFTGEVSRIQIPNDYIS